MSAPTNTVKHTPGPWRVGYRELHVVADNAKIGGDTPVCDIRGWGYLTGNGHGALGLPYGDAVKIQEANARLIAAAPDLLEAALKQEEADRLSEEGDDVAAMLAYADALKLRRAAISKATGSPAPQEKGGE